MADANNVVFKDAMDWLRIYSANPLKHQIKFELQYMLKDRLLFTVTFSNITLFFGIRFPVDYPEKNKATFYADWAGECHSQVECYLRRVMKDNLSHTIKSILSAVLDNIIRIKSAIDQQDYYQIQNSVDDDTLAEYTYDSDEEELVDEIVVLEQIRDEKLKLRLKDIGNLKAKILQRAFNVPDVKLTVSHNSEIFTVYIKDAEFLVDCSNLTTQGPKVTLVKPYVEYNKGMPVMSSGLVVIKGTTPYKWEPSQSVDLISKLSSLLRNLEPSEGVYEGDLVDVHYSLLKDQTEVEEHKFLGKMFSFIDPENVSYGCTVHPEIFSKNLLNDSIVAVELTTSLGVKTYCLLNGFHQGYPDSIGINKEIAENLLLSDVQQAELRIRLIKPKPVIGIGFRDTLEYFFNLPHYEDLIQDAINSYKILTVGSCIYVGENQTPVIIKSLHPSPCATTVTFQPSEREVNVFYYRPYAHFSQGRDLEGKQVEYVLEDLYGRKRLGFDSPRRGETHESPEDDRETASKPRRSSLGTPVYSSFSESSSSEPNSLGAPGYSAFSEGS